MELNLILNDHENNVVKTAMKMNIVPRIKEKLIIDDAAYEITDIEYGIKPKLSITISAKWHHFVVKLN